MLYFEDKQCRSASASVRSADLGTTAKIYTHRLDLAGHIPFGYGHKLLPVHEEHCVLGSDSSHSLH